MSEQSVVNNSKNTKNKKNSATLNQTNTINDICSQGVESKLS